jgi:hypothetical protein
MAARRARRGEAGVEMIQVALWAAAAIFIMAILVAAIALFVHIETNNIQAPANGGAGYVVSVSGSAV